MISLNHFSRAFVPNTAQKLLWLKSPVTSSVQLTLDFYPSSFSLTSVQHLTPYLTNYSWNIWRLWPRTLLVFLLPQKQESVCTIKVLPV
ncbi:hypothetical protein LDENG_00013740 [Lucifuga dentata]|nr:hypothetical protein LDENG_00013740 [Lucifuga dentata]